MTDRPSIAELHAWCGEPDCDEADGTYVCRRCRCTMVLAAGREPSPLCNACAQLVISDAAPVLLEIAAAALALRDQERVAARARFEVYRQKDAPDSAYAAIDAEDRKYDQFKRAYDAALTKVTP